MNSKGKIKLMRSLFVLMAAILISGLSSNVKSQTIIAIGKSISASSVEKAGMEAVNANDGNATTRWASTFSDPQWLQIDLGTTTTVTRVVLNWEDAYATAYQIQMSADGSTWTSIYNTSTGNGATDDLTGLSGSGRYIRMYGTTRASAYGYSIYEFQVYGSASSSSYPEIYDFSGEDAVTPASNLIDGNTDDASRWSVDNFPQWVIIDYGSNKSITGTRVWTYKDRAYQYTIELDDNLSFSSPYIVNRSSNTSANQPITDNFAAVTARYARITVTGASGYTGTWVSINELEIVEGTGDTQAPSIPANLSTSNVGQTSFTLSWTASTDNVGVTGYQIIRNGSVIGTTAATSYSVSGLACNTSYSMTVKAFDAAGNYSAASSAKSQTTSSCASSYPAIYDFSGEDAVTPASNLIDGNTDDASRWSVDNFPQWVIIDYGSNKSIIGTRVWTYKDRAYQYTIELDDNPGFSSPYTVNRSSNTSTGQPIADNFGAVTARYARITVTGASGYTGTWVSINELEIVEGAGDTQAPSAPTNLTTSNVGQTSFTLSWTASTDNVGVTGYQVLRNGTAIGTTSSASYNVSGLTCNTNYSMTVKAYDAAGNYSAASAVKSQTTSACGTVNYPVITDFSAAQEGNPASNIIDGYTGDGTKWSVDGGFPQWAIIDYGENLTITGTRLFTYQHRDYQFTIELDDNPNFTSPFVIDRSSSLADQQPIADNFAPTTVRYARLTVTGATTYTGTWVSINELFLIEEGYGAESGAPDLTGYNLLRNYDFGTGAGNNITSYTQLSTDFNPYGIAGTTPINSEWQRYQQFNNKNFVFSSDDLELTALADLGGVFQGGISSGQICTKETFYPSNDRIYVFQVRAKVPSIIGAWPAFWMYGKNAPNTDSEIDIFEFFDTPTQDAYDWTGYDHGSGVGTNYYNIMTNQWVWHPGWSFADDYHVYTLFWKEGDIQKWVDNTMVKGTNFDWIMGSYPQVLINLAMGGNTNNSPIASSFPCKFLVDYFKVYYKDGGSMPSAKSASTSLEFTDVKSELSGNVKIYPNPVNDVLNVSVGDLHEGQINIIDLEGKTILSKAITGKTEALNTGSMKEGVYILRITSIDKCINMKFVKK